MNDTLLYGYMHSQLQMFVSDLIAHVHLRRVHVATIDHFTDNRKVKSPIAHGHFAIS